MRSLSQSPQRMDPGKRVSRSQKLVNKDRRVHQGLARRVDNRVGYTCNRTGRLKHLKIRLLLRKFLYLWIHRTFGRVHPSHARSYCHQKIVQRAFEGWKEEWWIARREWRLSVRADCHYRYRLYSLTFINWRRYVTAQRERKERLDKAASYVEERCQRLVWKRWLIYVQVQQMKRSMQESAQKQWENTALRSAWLLWKGHLQVLNRQRTMEEDALLHWALTTQYRAWLQWRRAYMLICSLREWETRASQYHRHRLQRRALQAWVIYLCSRKAKREQTVANRNEKKFKVVSRCWCTWRALFLHRQNEKTKWQAASTLAERSMQLRALNHWKGYTNQRLKEADRDRSACEHNARRLLVMGLRLLTLNVTQRKVHRVNKNVALQQYQHSLISRFWRHWQERYEEVEERNQQPQKMTAVAQHSMNLLKSTMNCWRTRLNEHRLMQEMESKAERWFAGHGLSRCLTTWEEFVTKKKLSRKRKGMAEDHDQQRTYTWAFYTWWARSEEQRERRLAERMAVLHADQSTLSRAWVQWRSKALWTRVEREKSEAAERLYRHTLIHNTLQDWRSNIVLIQSEREKEQKVVRHDRLRCSERALAGWREYIQHRREKMGELEKVDHYYQCKLLKCTLHGWMKYHHRVKLVNHIAEERQRSHHRSLLRKALHIWKENVSLSIEEKNKNMKATKHYQCVLLSKVLVTWREATALTIYSHHQQAEALRRAQTHLQQVALLQAFQHWREKSKEVLQERRSMEKAYQHHNTALLHKSLRAWIWHIHKHRKRRVMQGQAHLLLQHRTQLHYFIFWQRQLQLKRHEAECTEVALWHWSLRLQAKVMEAWRSWVLERQRKQDRLARAAHFHRELLLREGVGRVLSYTADMSSFRVTLALQSQEQRTQRLQSIVWRCAMRWKQRALSEPGGSRARRHKKSVSFCLPAPISTSGSKGNNSKMVQFAEKGSTNNTSDQLISAKATRLQPRRSDHLLNSPDKEAPHTSLASCSQVSSSPLGSTDFIRGKEQPIPPTVASLGSSDTVQEAQTAQTDHQHRPAHQELLLPPSSFMQQRSALVVQPKCYSEVLLPPITFTTCQTGTPRGPVCERGNVAEMGSKLVETQCKIHTTSALTKELLSIQQEMRGFQQEKEQLQAWRRLAEVLRSWLQTSAEKVEEEYHSTRLELEELESRIRSLTVQLEEKKEVMQCYAARIRSIASELQEKGIEGT
ncbi:hypothetical protein AGOR_G00051750 [Albula goreensis]|uniref:Sfi1 spindle body domain-containing protein n=1 Tax=Albula goreensis TaxID=1534307 RepID=A0A8T3E1Z6_9TELE|nr:hypothetical protein AGOR_G00051750 [Albula goreensis]